MPAARTGPRPAPPPPAAAATAPDRAGPPPPDRRTRRADREGAAVPQPCAYSPNRHRVNAEGTVQASPVTPAQARPARTGQPATGATRRHPKPNSGHERPERRAGPRSSGPPQTHRLRATAPATGGHRAADGQQPADPRTDMTADEA